MLEGEVEEGRDVVEDVLGAVGEAEIRHQAKLVNIYTKTNSHFSPKRELKYKYIFRICIAN